MPENRFLLAAILLIGGAFAVLSILAAGVPVCMTFGTYSLRLFDAFAAGVVVGLILRRREP